MLFPQKSMPLCTATGLPENTGQTDKPTLREHACMKDEEKEPSLWLTVVKLLLIAVFLIGGTGLALWYVDQVQVREQPPLGSNAGTGEGSSGWGIVGDSPLRKNR
jgi:hypothetical protein